MIKKILTFLFIFILMLSQSVLADEIYKIKDVVFDTSASAIFINTTGTYQSSITDNIKCVKLPEAHKIYFDINSSVLLTKKQDLYFSTGVLKEFKISQFTTNPNVVRVVMIFNDNYDIENLKIGNINNHLIILTQELSETHAQFYQNIYRDKTKLSEDYYNSLILQVLSDKPIISNNIQYTQKELSQVQQAFDNSNATLETQFELVKHNLTDKINLRSKYFIKNIIPQNNGFLINGFGYPTIQKPFVLSNPTRIVFDFVNSNVEQKYNNQEFLLNPNQPNGDKIKIGRFDSNITRIVITSESAGQYLPIFSSDNQSVLIINPHKLYSSSIVTHKTNIIKYKYQKNISTDDFTLTFDNPVIWGIRRNSDYLYVYFFNAAQFNETVFKNSISKSCFESLELALLKNIGIRLKLPVSQNTDINTYSSADGKNFRLRVSGLKTPQIIQKSLKETYITSAGKITGKVVVIDAGHGGSDYGAIRDGINEKDINLDVAKRVESILTKKGFKVCMTRSDDTFVSLENRSNISNDVNPALFVSIHVNSCMGTEPKGIETHYYHENSEELADTIHKRLIKSIDTNNRGLFKSKFYVINHTLAPAILLEIGFISNEQERQELITSKRKQATAQAIAEGIIEYYNKHKK